MNGFFSPLLAKYRMQIIAPRLNGRVLDYGCGEAELCSLATFQSYTGVDLSVQVLKIAQRRFPDAHFITPNELPNLKEKFDTIVSVATIGLIADQPAFLRQMKGLLAKDGILVLTSPDPRVNWIHKIGGALRLFGNDMGYEHNSQLPSHEEMIRLAQETGFRVAEFKRFMLGANQIFILRTQKPSHPPEQS